MSDFTNKLLLDRSGDLVGCSGTQSEEKGSLQELKGLECAELWTKEPVFQDGLQHTSNDGPHTVTSSASALVNSLHLERRLGHITCRQQQTETYTPPKTETFLEAFRNMQMHIDPDVHAQAVSHTHIENCAHMDVNRHTGSVGTEQPRTLTPEDAHTAPPQPLPLALGNHHGSTNQLAAPVLTAETEMPATFFPVPIIPNPNPGSSPLPIEAEKKYALRSSGRPRFPCHLRKSSRLRRCIEDEEKIAERERGGEDDNEAIEKNIWRVKEEEVRKIVVKVARIPINLSRRQKSYKISNLETVTGTEKGNDGGLEGSETAREPTPLLRMKNNGKSVMVMFPPGELPVILKRRRGRPPKQALPGIPAETPSPGNVSGNGEQPKKPRRRRQTKLPLPYPSYVNDTNDAKTEYGDVLSKLAFLNRQPPATGRCSPPRCWTPSEPESFHAPLENPEISTLLHRLTGFRRRGGRGGGTGRGGGAAGRFRAGERSKSTFTDFFESIGRKRKPSSLSEHGLPRKRGKGLGGGGVGRGGGIVGTDPGGEKVRKKRMRRNGAFKGERGIPAGQDWANGAGGWVEEGVMDRKKGLVGYQFCGFPKGGFSSSEVVRGGSYSSPGGSKGAGPAGEDSQGLFAGYFRSLLDSDDSSDLLDISSSQANPNKLSSTTGYESNNTATGHSWTPSFSKWSSKGSSTGIEGQGLMQCSSARPPYSYSLAQTSPTTFIYHKSTPPSLSHSPSSTNPSSYSPYSSSYNSPSLAGAGTVPQRPSDCSFAYGFGQSTGKAAPIGQSQIGYSGFQPTAKRGYGRYPGAVQSSTARGEAIGPTSPGGGYMSVSKGSPFSSSSPEGYKQYNSNQWNYRQGYGGWSTDSFGPQYHGYSEYGSTESKDILDISNYTPQKAKRQPFPESLSESSSDSSHLGSIAPGGGPSSGGSTYKQHEPVPASEDGGQSSLSSLEKLMMDWHESASGPSYNWSQNVLFQGGGTSKPGRGRRKRADIHSEKEGGSAFHSDSPSSPSPTTSSGPKRGGGGGRPRGSRGGRCGFSPCQRERPAGAKGRAKAASTSGMGGAGTVGIPEGSGQFQEGLDYYSGDSSSLSPLSTTNPAPPASYLQEPCEYPSPYSAHPSTPSSEERYPALYPGESSASLSPSVSSPPYPPKPTPPPPQSYHPVPSRTFSPSCSPSPRLTAHCGTALSPSHRPFPKDPQFSQYDSPSYCSSPYWYGQTSHSSSPSPHSHSTHTNTVTHTHSNLHTSPHGNTHSNPLASPNANMHTHMNPTPHVHETHQLHSNLSSHTNTHMQSHPGLQLQSNPQTNNQLHQNTSTDPNPSLHPHSSNLLYEERSPPSTVPPHKRDLTPHNMSTGHQQGLSSHSPYPKPPLDSSLHLEDSGSYSLSHQSYQGIGHRYPSQAAQGSGVLCQLLDPASDDSFSVTSL
ncbi:AT-hook DNA-binding motif-containing protein 1 isoform X2 [Thalassophryne amazonica]|uniref:AT-hook DNA-binding motif-containing protein 1 isoform X2 n=1 Tax=Thalassophryne amazonica TaxID=390379 RepID=UPI00147209DE|nr:AT-hook DNA-binding motif-containing protein 1 isoform X2 [Thalassophryne amazonica]